MGNKLQIARIGYGSLETSSFSDFMDFGSLWEMTDTLFTYTDDILATESYEYLSNSLFKRAVLFDSVRIIIKCYRLSANISIL